LSRVGKRSSALNVIPALTAAIAFAIGGALGTTFADIDLAPPLLLRHRSAWTHSAWVALLLFLLRGRVPVYWFAIGFLPAHVMHLARDLFPEHWQGGSRISFYPLSGERLGGVLSFLWLLLNALATLAGWLWLAVSIYERCPRLW